ncbi:MAG: B12-binding domain-containing radical SAM protein, partial [Myxococcota bacterium]
WGVPYLFFHDSVFTLHRKRTLELCRLLVARDLVVPFTCQTRADRLDDELLDALAAAGCRHVMFGIESGDAETLARIHKAMPLARVRESVAATRARGMRTTGFFMIGFPWETREAIERTADFAVEVGVDMVSLFSAVPLPGTELWEIAGGGVPDAVDFRAPQVNLTRIPDYPELFAAVKARLTAYNEARMLTPRTGSAATP